MKKDDLLLIIDMQNVYTLNQPWACLETEKVADRISALLTSKPQLNAIFTQFLPVDKPEGVWKDYNYKYEEINNNPWYSEIVPQLKPFTGRYPLYTKSMYSSLVIPEVYEEVKKAKRVIISGVVAECCVLSTVFGLIDEGTYIIYLTDGVSGIDSEKEQATITALKGLSPLHLDFMTIKEYLEETI